MALYDHKQSVLTLSGYEITSFDESADSVSISNISDAGAYTIGSNGSGVFVITGNKSGTLVLKLLQHSADNEVLNQLYNQQINAIKSFTPIEMYFKDTLNGDEVMGNRGFFTTAPTTARGTAHNPTTWTIVFEKIQTKYKKGVLN